jgi:hypothetical protein
MLNDSKLQTQGFWCCETNLASSRSVYKARPTIITPIGLHPSSTGTFTYARSLARGNIDRSDIHTGLP